tara:strand:- start:117 stop:569 length:453 start_codon:yes stop_codon:yes gene_type:complete
MKTTALSFGIALALFALLTVFLGCGEQSPTEVPDIIVNPSDVIVDFPEDLTFTNAGPGVLVEILQVSPRTDGIEMFVDVWGKIINNSSASVEVESINVYAVINGRTRKLAVTWAYAPEEVPAASVQRFYAKTETFTSVQVLSFWVEVNFL